MNFARNADGSPVLEERELTDEERAELSTRNANRRLLDDALRRRAVKDRLATDPVLAGVRRKVEDAQKAVVRAQSDARRILARAQTEAHLIITQATAEADRIRAGVQVDDDAVGRIVERVLETAVRIGLQSDGDAVEPDAAAEAAEPDVDLTLAPLPEPVSSEAPATQSLSDEEAGAHAGEAPVDKPAESPEESGVHPSDDESEASDVERTEG